MKRLLNKLFHRNRDPFRVGEIVRYRGRFMAVSRIADGAAELVWQDEAGLHTVGFIPARKIQGIAQ